MPERWLPVPGLGDRYEVSDLGGFREDGVMLTLCRAGKGRSYYYAKITTPDGRKTIRSVHTMLLLAFVGPRPKGMLTRHLNGDGLDNRLENLAYGTQSENMRDSIAHGTHPTASKTHCKRGHEFTPDNIYRTHSGTGRACRTCVIAASAKRRRPLASNAGTVRA